jgi:uncharacterized membrane protein
MKRHLLRFFLYGSLGFTTEIIFTSYYDLFEKIYLDIPFDLKLTGLTYFWMFFIYRFGSILFPFAHKFIQHYSLFTRLLLMAIGIFCIEFIAGAVLDFTFGSCPWEYSSPVNVMGYIRLDYLPAWILFGFIMEKADKIFDKMTINFQ